MSTVSGSGLTSASQVGNLISELTAQTKTKEQLKDLFSQSYFNNTGSIGDIDEAIRELNEEYDSLSEELKEAEALMKSYNTNIESNSSQLATVVKQIAEEIGNYNDRYQEGIDNALQEAITKVSNSFTAYNTGYGWGNVQGGTTITFESAFQEALRNNLPGDNSLVLKGLYTKQGGLQSQIEKSCKALDDAINKSTFTQQRMVTIQNSMKGLSALKTKLENAKRSATYQNSNVDAKVPVYTYDQETKIAEIASKYGIDINARGTEIANANEGVRDEEKIAGLKTDMQNLVSGKTKGTGDQWALGADNALLAALQEAMFGNPPEVGATVKEGSLVWQMAEAGMTNVEILEVICQTFGTDREDGQGIGRADHPFGRIPGTNNFKIPYGHGADAAAIFSVVSAIANNTAGLPTIQPREVSEGEKELVNKAALVVKDLADAKFSFKEAMFALNNLFPGIDMGYNLAEQAAQQGTYPQGFVQLTENEAYKPLVDAIQAQIDNGNWTDSKIVLMPEAIVENETVNVTHTDPISLKVGNSRIYFMADNGYEQYDGVKDLLGYNDGMNDFATKYGLELGQKYTIEDNPELFDSIMVMKMEEVKDPVTGEVTMKQSFMSAKEAGMTEIDLSSTTEGTSYNINNSIIQNTFNVKINGNDVKAEQALEDDDYLSATLNNAGLSGAAYTVKLGDDELNSMFSDVLDDPSLEATITYLETNAGAFVNKMREALAAGNPIMSYDEFMAMVRNNQLTIESIAQLGNTIYNNKQDNGDGTFSFSFSSNDETKIASAHADITGGNLKDVLSESIAVVLREKYGVPIGLEKDSPEYKQFLSNIVENISLMIYKQVLENSEAES